METRDIRLHTDINNPERRNDAIRVIEKKITDELKERDSLFIKGNNYFCSTEGEKAFCASKLLDNLSGRYTDDTLVAMSVYGKIEMQKKGSKSA